MFQRFINKYRNYTVYKKDMDKFNKDKEIYITLNKDERFRVNELSPVLNDYRQNAGMIGGYFWQDLWGAKRVLADIKDGVKHYDIGSRVDGFIAHLLSGGV